jgi:hypothetical protein
VRRAVIPLVLRSLMVGLAGGRAGELCAQGPTTAAIAGRVTDDSGRGVTSAEIAVTNEATGALTRIRSRADGRYDAAGLEVGGPYSVTVRSLGSGTKRVTGVFLNLGQRLQLDVQLEPRPVTLAPVDVRANQDRTFSRAHKGTESFIGDSTIHRMPLVNRDMYDLLRLVPEVATWNAMSGGGVGPRLNSIQIDGVSDQTVFGGVPAGSVLGGRSISLEAVKEYQVLLSPFDVRLGNFAGATINAVTRRGTNELQGAAFAYGTNERLGPDVAFIRDARYSKTGFGFSLGGPILRDRLYFFVAPEFQRRFIPAIGPYVGQDASTETPLPVTDVDVRRFQQILTGYGLNGGSAGAVENDNPASNVFARLDAPLPRWNSRIVLLGNYSQVDSNVFARPTPVPNSNCPTPACFPLSSLQQRRSFKKQSLAVQLFSTLSGGAHNELIVSHLATPSSIGPTIKAPLVLVTTRGSNGQSAVMQSGSHEISTADSTENFSTQITDNLTIPLRQHRITFGISSQLFKIRRFDLRGAYGIWDFASLDSLDAGLATSYRVVQDVGTAEVPLHGSQHAVYLSDDWDPTPRLSLTFGLRADIPLVRWKPPYMASVDSLLGRRTDEFPSGQVQWSPRIGFNLDLTGSDDRLTQLRGGVGLFTARPPIAYLFGPFANYGITSGTLRCGSLAGAMGPPPAFSPDYQDPPLTCANGQGFGAVTPAEIDLMDPELRFPQVLRASLAADRQLPLGIVGTIEGLYTRGFRTLFFSPANLTDPIGVDRRGRVMYGTIAPTGLATPSRITTRFADVISVTNASQDYAYDLTAQLQKTFGVRGNAQVSFTHARSRDVQSLRAVRPVLLDNWRLSRTVAGRQEATATGVSDFDQPYRVRASGTIYSPWRRWGTDLSFYYVGGSGLPFTYVAGGAAPRGDLNGDGAAGNDPIYIPRSALDTVEIRFAGAPSEVAAQQAALDQFIDGASCLREQRGKIMARNSCRSPWSNLVHATLRQSLPTTRNRDLSVELQVFNLLNLLNSDWGRVQLPTLMNTAVTMQVPLLSQTGQTIGSVSQSQPIYRFDAAMRRYSDMNVDSYYQLQLAVRYNF